MSTWSSIANAGSFVLSSAGKKASVYETSMHLTSELESDTESSLGLIDTAELWTTGFLKTKVKNNGIAVIKKYVDSDGDGVFSKGDDLIASTKFDASSLGILYEGTTSKHSILGSVGNLYAIGVKDASKAAKTALGFEKDATSSLGLSDDISSGINILSSIGGFILPWMA